MRKTITDILTEAASHYFIKKLYSVHKEFGVDRRGRRRFDLLCLNNKAELIGVEVKSCKADYMSDKKWHEYLPHCDKLYFMIPPKALKSTFVEKIKEETKEHGVGIMSLDDSGRVYVVQRATVRRVHDEDRNKIIIKMAWRNGISRREVKRIKKFFIED